MALFLVAVPASDGEYGRLVNCAQGAARGCHATEFVCPPLKVGTLDSLMTLSDELGKIDFMGEAVAKKIRRIFEELKVKGQDDRELLIDGLDPKAYIEQFAWKFERFPKDWKLPKMVTFMQGKMDSIDQNMKKLNAEYTDAKSKLAALNRKSAGNLLVADLNDMLTAEVLGDQPIEDVFASTAYTRTVAVVVSSKEKEAFEESYMTFDSEAVVLKQAAERAKPAGNAGAASAPFTVVTPSGRSLAVTVAYAEGGKPCVRDLKLATEAQHGIKYEHQQFEWDDDLIGDDTALGDEIAFGAKLNLQLESPQGVVQIKEKFSPVLPGSARWLMDDNDGYSLYAVKLLRGQNDAFLDGFKKACVEQRHTVRLWEPPTETKQGTETLKAQLERVERQYNKLMRNLLRYSVPWYTEMFSTWMHLKVIRVFVDSVLNFGVPANFVSALIECKPKDAKKVYQALDKQYKHLDAVGVSQLDANDAAVQALGGNEEYHPYVLVPISYL